MRHGATLEPGIPGRRCRLPEPPKSHSAEQDPVQRLFAFAYLQEQKGRREAEEELRKDSARLSAVIATQHRIATSPLNLDQALELIVEQTRSLTGAGGVAIALRSGREVVCRARSGLLAPQVGARLDPEAGISGACLGSGEIQLVDDTEGDPRVDVWVCRALGIRSILAVPVRSQQEVLGILEIFSGWAGAFTERDVRTTKLLAGLVIEALWSQQVQQRQAPAPTPMAAAPTLDDAQILAALDELEASIAQPDLVTVPDVDASPAPALDDAQIAAALAELAASIAQSDLVTPTQEDEAELEAIAVPAGLDLEAPAFNLLAATEPRPLGPVLKMVALAVLVLVAAVGTAVWLGNLRGKAGTTVRTAPLPGVSEPAGPPNQREPVAETPAGPVQVTSIRHWSKPDATTLAIFMESPARWDSGVLSNPSRIYFDLSNAQLAGELIGNSKDGATIPVNDGLVQRIRVVPKDGGALRVVIDLLAPAEHSSVFSPAEPYRLMVAIRGTKVAKSAPADVSKGKAAAEGREAGQTPAAARNVKIIIDPGHGGSEDGAIGHGGLKEKDLVLAISRRLGELLTARLGVQVMYTRVDDRNVPLEMRAVMANEASADLFVSIHANSSGDPNSRGVETYYLDGRRSPAGLAIAARENAGAHSKKAVLQAVGETQKLTESRKLAGDVQQAVYQTFGGEKGVLNRGVKQAPFLVLLDAEMPSILAEVAFVTSPADEQKLSTAEGQDAVAEGLYRGIARYLASTKGGKVVASLSAQHGQ